MAKARQKKTVTKNIFSDLKKLGRAGMSKSRLKELTEDGKKKKKK